MNRVGAKGRWNNFWWRATDRVHTVEYSFAAVRTMYKNVVSVFIAPVREEFNSQLPTHKD